MADDNGIGRGFFDSGKQVLGSAHNSLGFAEGKAAF